MTGNETSAQRRAARLLALYPAPWRQRYGTEFTALLLDEIDERPRDARRTLDVLRAAITERCTDSGLIGDRHSPADRTRAASRLVTAIAVPFCLIALALWSQLGVSWSWRAPSHSSVAAGMWLMSLSLIGLAAIITTATASFTGNLWRALRHDPTSRRRLAWPICLALAGATSLILGSRHFAHNWPGYGSAPWAWRYLASAHLAGPAWAATLSISTYWAHPSALGAFSTGRIAWMALSPLAWLALIAGTTLIVKRAPAARPRKPASAALFAITAATLMLPFTAGACAWLFTTPNNGNLFQPGVIDFISLTGLSGATLLAFAAARRALRAWLETAATPTPELTR